MSEPLFVTIESSDKGNQIKTNLPPAQRPLMLWMLEQAKLMILTQPSEQEKSQISKPDNGFVSNMRRMMR